MAAAKSEVESSQQNLTESSIKDSKIKLRPTYEHVIRKRLPPRLPKSDKDFYITNKTNFKAQLNKCEKLLDSGEQEIVIHALGAAVSRACNLALQLKENHHGTVDLDINTSTVDITDDFEPITDDADYEVNQRQNSAIHIRVFRTALFETFK
ncbi:ribonuclease P protein subunit p20 isoform X1 [Neodiprion pinetum]|uniref:Ribonuclease P protein subunit p20 n=1 Tax=Neodiprion lecontei TaxID=441921 RepID=A0A6J0BGM0_NEOLC|nr:ribonuclease P protein subunit p20 isoform X1 [Neodiprion lecontei]XP_046479771.1 ribonuclease P protein subunit p20 isoform X1 [Neodiprion pinetum]XP_046614660.1 ribonuclease P protein subunit p20 isoform X1 [Neodiprion virginianus]